MKLYVLFGLPGAGKSYVGKIFRDQFGFYFHDGDLSLPKKMQQALDREQTITDDMRNSFIDNLIKDTKKLLATHNLLVVTQTFIKERHRQQFLKHFPAAEFVLIEASDNIRLKRLMMRKNSPLSLSYASQMALNFDKPLIYFKTILNNLDGDTDIIRQIKNLLASG